ncbi:MAG TPA: lamin tail domain-containing protein [Cyclobacteriaceae bacterium]|nr:lamin tail domain-containing protein [Cyclobacteriaceae bacterium]
MNLKFRTCLLLIFIASDCCAQFADDFSDGNFSQDPVWSGNTSKFNIKSNMLHLQAVALNESAYLSTSSEVADHAIWELLIQLDFIPSSSNYTKVYLMADQPDLTAPLNGYFVKIGNSTRDISLYRQSGDTETKIIDGIDNRVNAPIVKLKIRVTRERGLWTLFYDLGPTGVYQSEGAATDVVHPTSTYFGVVCVYTATRSDKFWFDDVVVSGTPGTVKAPATYLWKDIIINEFLADPNPHIGLPDAEFIELFNRSTDTISLENWIITDGSSHVALPASALPPGGYTILTSIEGLSGYLALGQTLGVNNFPTINNGGESLWLMDPAGHTIDSIKFDLSWYRDADKAEGGWSLELIDPTNPCGEEDNWIAAETPAGGTPGHRNSVFANKPDLIGPEWLEIFPVSANKIQLTFSEKLDKNISTRYFSMTPVLEIKQVTFTDQTLRTLLVSLQDSMRRNTTYSLRIEKIRDCNQNEIAPMSRNIGIIEPADSLDVVINEILFNPRPGGVDFVEVVNASKHFIDTRNWTLATASQGPAVLAANHRLLAPGEFAVFTSDPSVIQGQYPSAKTNVLYHITLPALADDESLVWLRDNLGRTIDRVEYDKKWHNPFLKSQDGVSLERISVTSPTQSPANWASASSLFGFATPGYPNSQRSLDSLPSEATVWVDPELFAPGDSRWEQAKIHYQFGEAGWLVNVLVIDQQQRLIKVIADAETIPEQGFFVWQGDRDNGTKANLGYYTLWFQAVHPNGAVRTFWCRIVVASRE